MCDTSPVEKGYSYVLKKCYYAELLLMAFFIRAVLQFKKK